MLNNGLVRRRFQTFARIAFKLKEKIAIKKSTCVLAAEQRFVNHGQGCSGRNSKTDVVQVNG